MKKITVTFDSPQDLMDIIGMINTALQIKGLEAAASCLKQATTLKNALEKFAISNPPEPVKK